MKILFVIVGLIILGCAIVFLRKQKYLSAITCVILAVIMLLADPVSFQGFLKTGIIAILNSYGTKINHLQDTLVGQQNELQSNQQAIAISLSCVTNQQSSLFRQQKELEQQQCSISSQHFALGIVRDDLKRAEEHLAKQQTNIDTLVRTIFDERETEVFLTSDTNRIVHVIRGSNALWLVFKLNKAPIQNSILGYYDNSVMKPPILCVGNVAFAIFVADWKTCEKAEYRLSYIPNPKATQIFDRIDVRSNDVYIGQQKLPLQREK